MSTPLKVLAWVGGVLIAAVVIGLVWLVTFWLGVFNANVKASSAKRTVTARVEQKVRGADFAQAAYEQFFNDCNAVVADNAKIDIARQRVAEAKTAPEDAFGTKASKVADAEADLAGVQQAQVDTAARYNAAAAEYTRGQFLDASLPARLDAPFNISCS